MGGSGTILFMAEVQRRRGKHYKILGAQIVFCENLRIYIYMYIYIYREREENNTFCENLKKQIGKLISMRKPRTYIGTLHFQRKQ